MGKYDRLPESPIALSDLVREIQEKKGIEVIRFDVAEPQFPSPKEALEGTIEAIKSGLTRYTPPRGLPKLVSAVCQYLKVTRSLDYGEEEVIITPGAKFAVYSALKAVLDPGDEVILISPYWVSFKSIPLMLGARVVEVRMKKPYGLDEEFLKGAVNSRTKAIIINTPHNPTGWVFTKEELKVIRDLAVDHDLFVISDEVDWAYVYEGEYVSPASVPGMREKAIVIDSFSKVYSMTGWRVGFAAGPKEVIDDMLAIQQHTVSAPATFAQWGCLKLLEHVVSDRTYIDSLVKLCRSNRDYIVKELGSIDGVECPKPPGAFYLFPSIEALGIHSDVLVRELLSHGVAVAPGHLFGAEFKYYFRVCYALPKEMVVVGIDRMKKYFSMRTHSRG